MTVCGSRGSRGALRRGYFRRYPVEIRARVEANALFDALQTGDYASAAQAQGRLQSLGCT